jgi:WD40 repeat protein
VATRVALKARAHAARQRQRQKEMADVPTADTTEAVDWRDLRPVLDQEISRLPDKYREPFVMAYLEGKTNAEVAQALGCPLGTVFGRLARARERLRSRLARRGLALSGTALAALLAGNDLTAAVPAELAGPTLKAAARVAAGDAVAAGSVAALVKEALRDMFLSRTRVALLLVLSAGLLGLGTASALRLAHAASEAVLDESDCAPAPDLTARPLPAGAIARIGSPHFRFVGAGIARLAYSPDGKYLAAAGYGSQLETAIVVWDAKTGKEAHRFHRENLLKQRTGRDETPDGISALAFSPDGKMLAWAVSWPEKVVYLWDAATGKELHALKGSQAPAFSPDGKTLAGSGSDGTVRLWSVATGKERRALPGSAGPVAFTADGKWLATGGTDRLIHVWEAASGKEVRKLAVGMEKQRQEAVIFPESFTFAPSGPLLALRWGVTPAAGGSSMPGNSYGPVTVQVWDTSSGKKVLEVAEGMSHGGEPWQCSAFLAFAPDGRTLYSRGLKESVAHALEVTARLRVRPAELAQIEGVTQLAVLSPDGQTLASWGGRLIRLWATASGKEKALHPDGHSDSVHQLAIAPDGKTLVSASADWTVGVWDLNSGKALRRLRPVRYLPPHVFALALGGKALVVRGDEVFTTWDLATGKELHPGKKNVLPRAGWVQEFEVSPDGRTLAWAAGDKVWLADLATNKEQAGFAYGPVVLRGMAFSPDGKSLALAQEVELGTGRCRVLVRDLPGGTVRATLPPAGALTFQHFRFLADGKALVTDDNSGVRFWDVKSGKETRQIAGRMWAGFSPDGRSIVTGTADTLFVEETASGKELFRLRVPGGWQARVAFSPNGKVLAVAEPDGAIRLLDAATGKERRALRGHQGAVRALAFSPDGKALASGSMDTTIFIWDVKDTAR